MAASACTTTSPWLRRTPNGGLRASKASRSVLHGAAPVLATIDEGSGLSQQREQARAPNVCFSDRGRGTVESSAMSGPVSVRSPASTPTSGWPLTPTTPRRTSHPVPVDVDSSSDEEVGDGSFGFRAVPVDEEQVVVVGVRESADPTSPMSSRSRQTTGTDNSVQIVRAHRIQTARARSHSINDLKKGLLSPPPEPSSHSSCLPPWAPLKTTRAPLTPLKPSRASSSTGPQTAPLNGGPSTPPSAPGTPKSAPLRSYAPASPSSPARTCRRRGPGPSAIAKDLGSLLEHINEDDTESHSSHASSHITVGCRPTRSVSLPSLARQRSDSVPVSLPPPPRPRNKALIRPGSAQSNNSSPSTPMTPNSVLTPIQSSELTRPPPTIVVPPRQTSLSELPPLPPPKVTCRPPPTLSIPPPPHRDSLEVTQSRRSSLHSIPLTPVGIPLPPSAVTPAFPQSPRSTVFYSSPSNPTSPQQSTFLPSCKAASIDSGTIRDDPSSPRPSEDRRDYFDRMYRASTLSALSTPFGDFSFLRPHNHHRASGISFASDVSGYSARSATEAESIPIGLHIDRSSHEREHMPVSPRSSFLRDVGFGSSFEVHLPEADEDEEDDESVTEEESKKSSVFTRERAKSLTLPHIKIASLNKVDRILGRGAARALLKENSYITGVHVHAPHLSVSSMASENAPVEQTQSADPAQQSFLPQTAPPSAFSMSNLGRRLSKKTGPATERRRSEEVHRSSSASSGSLMARMDRFIGRTPSPAGRTRELEDDEAPPPPPIPTFPRPTHSRKHSGSDPSLGLATPPSLSDRPSTTNIRTAAERAEMVKKARKIQQLLGDVPPSGEASAFYRLSRAARSEDSVLTPVSGRCDVIVGGGASDDARLGHRSTASLSSRPRLSLSPALTLPAFADLRTPGTDEFGLDLISPSAPSPSPEVKTEAEPDEPRVDEVEDDKTDDEAALARRAKRAKLAKLYRYLGSRVPPNLALGLDEDKWDYEQGLPEVRSEDEGTGVSILVGGKKKRRASEGDYALLEDTMGDLSVMSSEEKARAVRRKAKMEKMFGERPPQRLYQPLGDSTPRNEGESAVDDAELELDDADAGAHYRSYRASFNSLAYFVNNADRDSLEGLYDIISGPAGEEEDNEEQARSQFAARRKRAAKLSNFFGVSYRDLFGAVLDILESDVREDKEEGSLSAAETQDLLLKLKKLKAKGEGIHI